LLQNSCSSPSRRRPRPGCRRGLIGGPTALLEVDDFRLLTDPTFDTPGAYRLPHVTTDGWAHFRQNANDLRASFDTLGFGSRLKLLEPGVATVIEPLRTPKALTSS
jgi:hypothetical protein